MKITLPQDRVPRALVCRWADVKEPTHARWAAHGIVRDPGQMGCGLADAVELAVVARLFEHLGPDDARLAYSQIRDEIRELAEPRPILDVVWDARFQKATLIRSESELVPLVRTGREFCVIPFAGDVADMIAAHHRAVADRWARAGSSANAPSARSRPTKLRRLKPGRGPS